MRTTAIMCLGAIALLAMEIAFSMQIRSYESQRAPNAAAKRAFFCGPITATLGTLLGIGTDEPAAKRKI